MRKKLACAIAFAAALVSSTSAMAWTLEQAAEPYKGTSIKAIFLDRPGYAAAIKLLPEFEKKTGIKVDYEIVPYENSRERQVLDFTAGGEIDVVLTDVVWIGEFAGNGWLEPIKTFTDDEDLADPNLKLNGFFPILLESFGTWGDEVYGLPFDNYSGLLYYNRCMLQEAGFDKPPATWDELLNVYGPKLTDQANRKYAFALQSRRGETQSADSFMRVLWPFGGSLLDDKFKSNLNSPESQAGLKFRQDLMKIMPPGIVDYDHAEAVNALAQGNVAMITEWSAFYSTLADPTKSRITDCLAVATEPAGPAGLKPALGGFSLGVNAQSSDDKKAAAWLFIQWVTSEEMAKPYVEAGGVSGRTSVYKDADIQKRYPFVQPMVTSWDDGVPDFRPRFAEWPEISEVVAEWGTRMMLGNVSVEEGARSIGTRVEEILGQAGYYDGSKPLRK
ncbi:sugar ABC transporter substrate-binding protein (plasmid) [Skermanella rosea]|uniref:ABC transporter substrate-binding protein n=1 Tax=Skermanella rosea TaxID=1817965 RepID=UPI0019342578|nr:sugar ABC transporter substrate-binding protein [Skermanella rosea]UEM07071.1 sugar ABC transporter substrate-binding protein [Skermanella rosea]